MAFTMSNPVGRWGLLLGFNLGLQGWQQIRQRFIMLAGCRKERCYIPIQIFRHGAGDSFMFPLPSWMEQRGAIQDLISSLIRMGRTW